MLESKLHVHAKLRYLSKQPGDVDCTYADIIKSKEKLNYQPKINIEEGLSRFISWKNQQRS